MNQDKSDILFSLLSIWGILLFMIFFSLAGKAGAYEEYAREQAARSEVVEGEAGMEAFAGDPSDSSGEAPRGETVLSDDPSHGGNAMPRGNDPITTRQKIGASVIVAVGAVTLTACGVAASRKMREKQGK